MTAKQPSDRPRASARKAPAHEYDVFTESGEHFKSGLLRLMAEGWEVVTYAISAEPLPQKKGPVGVADLLKMADERVTHSVIVRRLEPAPRSQRRSSQTAV